MARKKTVDDDFRARIAERAKALREARGLTQDKAAELSAGRLTRVEITKIETGANLVSTARTQEGLAAAYGVPFTLVEPYLRGSVTLQDLLSTAGPLGNGHARFGNLEAALAYHEGKWHPVTVATARAIATCFQEDPSPRDWALKLDAIETTLRQAKLLPKGG